MLTNHTLLRLRNLPFARALNHREFRPLFTGNDPKNSLRWVRFPKRTHRFLSHISCITHVFAVPYKKNHKKTVGSFRRNTCFEDALLRSFPCSGGLSRRRDHAVLGSQTADLSPCRPAFCSHKPPSESDGAESAERSLTTRHTLYSRGKRRRRLRQSRRSPREGGRNGFVFRERTHLQTLLQKSQVFVNIVNT